MNQGVAGRRVRFEQYELDLETQELKKDGRSIRLSPQPSRLLTLLVANAGRLVTRDQIRTELWGADTFVDFAQSVNFIVKQIRDALDDDAERPRFVETVPRRGYRFIARVASFEAPPPASPSRFRRGFTEINLHKALWANIAEMRMAEQRRRRIAYAAVALLAVAMLVTAILWAR